MYKFIDVNEFQEEKVLPLEALSLNGEYIENQIEGYRTLYVKGREALSPELDSFETGIRDGSILKNKRFPARIITVGYQLIEETSEAFRHSYNLLGGILNVEDAELIFNDELDRYYIGTFNGISEVEPGSNAIVGEFEFYCADPFKYSIEEFEAEANLVENSILIDYQGTYKSFPTLQADFYKEDEGSGSLTGNGDCGYVAFFTEDEKIIQLGDPDEKDTQTGFAKSQTLANQEFKTTGAWGSSQQALWGLNNGYPQAGVAQGGTLAIQMASWNTTHTTNTSASIYSGKADGGNPMFNYKVSVKTSNRTSSSVKLVFSITASLGKDTNYFGRGYGLKAGIYVGGAWREVTLKTTSAYWRGRTAHTVNLTVNLSNLSSTSTSISGVKFRVVRIDSVGGAAGKLSEKSCKNIPISKASETIPETYYLMPNNYGSGNGWHGPSMTKTMGADSAGEVGATHFTLSYGQKMCIGNGQTSQLGAFQVQIVDGSNKHIAGVRIAKSASGNNATVSYFMNGSVVATQSIDLSYNNRYFGNNSTAKGIVTAKSSTITKEGAKVTFNLGGLVKTFSNSAIANLKAVKVTFVIERYASTTPLQFNGIYNIKFVKNNCATYKDIPNKFSANDVVVADCKDGKVYLNDIETPALGALGNDWENFILTPGLNQIGFSYSEWVSDAYKPTFKVRYREVFL